MIVIGTFVGCCSMAAFSVDFFFIHDLRMLRLVTASHTQMVYILNNIISTTRIVVKRKIQFSFADEIERKREKKAKRKQNSVLANMEEGRR